MRVPFVVKKPFFKKGHNQTHEGDFRDFAKNAAQRRVQVLH